MCYSPFFIHFMYCVNVWNKALELFEYLLRIGFSFFSCFEHFTSNNCSAFLCSQMNCCHYQIHYLNYNPDQYCFERNISADKNPELPQTSTCRLSCIRHRNFIARFIFTKFGGQFMWECKLQECVFLLHNIISSEHYQ